MPAGQWAEEIWIDIHGLKLEGIRFERVPREWKLIDLFARQEWHERLCVSFSEEVILAGLAFVDCRASLFKYLVTLDPNNEAARFHRGPIWGWYENGCCYSYAHGFEEGSPTIRELGFREFLQDQILATVEASGQKELLLLGV